MTENQKYCLGVNVTLSFTTEGFRVSFTPVIEEKQGGKILVGTYPPILSPGRKGANNYDAEEVNIDD